METTTSITTTKWTVDPAHSELQFKVKHLMITNITGGFHKFDATVETEGDDFSSAKIQVSVDAGSITTGSDQRDGHVKGADFFDVAQFPNITFKSTRVKKVDNEGSYELQGDLTIKNITKPVKLAVEFGGLQKDPWGNIKAGFTINGKIKRNDWDLNWNAALESGGVLVSEEVKILGEVQFVKQA